MRIGKLARALAGALGVCVGLAVIAYAVLFAINWSDEVPSNDALALAQIVASKPDVPDAANAWVFNLGIAVPEGQDPFEQGSRRKTYLLHFPPPERQTYGSLPGPEIQYAAARSPAINALASACRKGNAECARLVHRDFAQVEHWLASESWLLDRFTRMEGLREWKEVVPKHVGAPIGMLKPAFDGQQLLLMQAWKQARAGDGKGARALLDRDFVFWRMVLRSADTLITKLMATAALERNLSVGNLVLADLHAAGRTTPPPTAWTRPFTLEERSMRRVFAGEYVYQSSSLASLASAPDVVSPNRLKNALLRPFLKPQATNNLRARDFMRDSERFDVDYRAMTAAAEAAARDAAAVDARFHAYNYIGHVLHAVGSSSDMGKYAVRVSDLEGIRRAALLAAEMRGRPADGTDVEARVQAAGWKDPYTDAPFAWDPKTASIVFTGLVSGERGRYAMSLPGVFGTAPHGSSH
jgi:hypothetical protein